MTGVQTCALPIWKVLFDKVYTPEFIRSEVTDTFELPGLYKFAYRGVRSCDVDVDLFAE